MLAQPVVRQQPAAFRKLGLALGLTQLMILKDIYGGPAFHSVRAHIEGKLGGIDDQGSGPVVARFAPWALKLIRVDTLGHGAPVRRARVVPPRGRRSPCQPG